LRLIDTDFWRFMRTALMAPRVTPAARGNDVCRGVFAVVLAGDSMLRRALKMSDELHWQLMDARKTIAVIVPHRIQTVKTKVILMDGG
jgi:hypothetical protein